MYRIYMVIHKVGKINQDEQKALIEFLYKIGAVLTHRVAIMSEYFPQDDKYEGTDLFVVFRGFQELTRAFQYVKSQGYKASVYELKSSESNDTPVMSAFMKATNLFEDTLDKEV